MVCHLKVAKLMLYVRGHNHKMWPTCSNSSGCAIIIDVSLLDFLKWRRHLHCWPEKISNLLGAVCRKLHLCDWKSYYVVLLFYVCLTILYRQELYVTHPIIVWVAFLNSSTKWPTSGTQLSTIPNAFRLLSEIIVQLTRNMLQLDSAWSAGDIS